MFQHQVESLPKRVHKHILLFGWPHTFGHIVNFHMFNSNLFCKIWGIVVTPHTVNLMVTNRGCSHNTRLLIIQALALRPSSHLEKGTGLQISASDLIRLPSLLRVKWHALMTLPLFPLKLSCRTFRVSLSHAKDVISAHCRTPGDCTSVLANGREAPTFSLESSFQGNYSWPTPCSVITCSVPRNLHLF